jgi:hypothetical protein
VISRDSIREILVDSASSGVSADIDYGSELVIDSFTLVWLKHELEERHGVVIDPQYEDLAKFTSIDGIHEYLATVAPDRVAMQEESR